MRRVEIRGDLESDLRAIVSNADRHGFQKELPTEARNCFGCLIALVATMLLGGGVALIAGFGISGCFGWIATLALLGGLPLAAAALDDILLLDYGRNVSTKTMLILALCLAPVGLWIVGFVIYLVVG